MFERERHPWEFGPEYWASRYGSGWIRRFGASPAFEAGASLLRSAARLWQGRYGAGRLVGREALELASRMADLGQHWHESAVYWTAGLLPEGAVGRRSGYLLGKFRDRRSFRLADDAPEIKHPDGARRLVQAVLEMASDRIRIIRESGRDVGDYGKDAELWEDRFEKLGETSLGVLPAPPLSEEGRRALEEFAVYRACEGFCASGGNVLAFHGHWSDRNRQRPKEADEWLAYESRFRALARQAYERFVNGPGLDTAEYAALLAVRDDAIPYLEFAEFHHYDAEDQRGATLIAAFYVSLMLASIGADIGAEWNETMLGKILKAANIKKLPPAPKALPEPADR